MFDNCNVTACNGALRIQTPYNAGFLAAIKALPSNARRYDQPTRTWLVDTQYAGEVRELIQRFFGEDIGDLSNLGTVSDPKTDIRVCDVWYLGRTKPAGDEYQAYGMNAQKEWAFIFPECVLLEWFEGGAQYARAATLYGLLGIKRTAAADEIKFAYRRLAKQWHPDVCKEPNAKENFMKIKDAYELLINPDKRAKYDAGLALQESLKNNIDKLQDSYAGYRAPLRCGYILAKGYEKLGRFVISEIIMWEDIVTEKGTLVASWKAGANEPEWSWI